MSGYRVEFVTPYVSLTSTLGDPAAYGLADPCSMTSSVPNADLAPLVQRNADEATVTIIAPDPFTYQLSMGDPVRLTFYTDTVVNTNGVASFYGRIAQLQAQPHKLGVLYTLMCVDYLADLEELKAGRVDYPLESSQTRVNRMLAENGIGPVLVPAGETYPGGFNDPNVAARVSATDGVVPLMEALESVLAGWTEGFGTDELGTATVNIFNGRWELVPNIVNGALDPVSPFALSKVMRPRGWTPPARLSDKPGAKLTVDKADTSPATDTLVLDGGHVDFDPLFTQAKGNAVQRIVVRFAGNQYVTADWSGMGYYQWRADQSTVEATLTVAQSVASTVAPTMYRGQIQPDPGLAWTVGELTWHGSRTEGLRYALPKLRRVVVVSRVDAVNATSHNPLGKAYVYGVVDSVRHQVAGGELVTYFTLAPMHYTVAGSQFSGVPYMAQYQEWVSTLRRNLQPVPQVGAAGVSASYGTSTTGWGTAPTVTDNATGGPTLGGASVPFRRFTAVVAFTPPLSSVFMLQQRAVPGCATNGSIAIHAGETLTLSIYVRSSIAQVVNLWAILQDSAGTGAGSGTGGAVTLVANTWTRLTVTVTGVVDGLVRLDVRSGNASTVAWAVGNTLDFAAVQIERAAAATAYFDGSFPVAGIKAYTWEHRDGIVGTANTVPSAEQSGLLVFTDLDSRDTFADYLLMHG